MKYRKGYKYQLAETEVFMTSIFDFNCKTEFLELHPNGKVVIRSGYAWDGTSGPTIDGKTNMRGSLLHDGLYELMRKGLLPLSYKKLSDLEFIRICDEDGMWAIRQWVDLKGLEGFGTSSTLPKNQKKVYEAP